MGRNLTFKNGNYYYVHNSGKGSEDLFEDKWDYARFVFSLAYLNTEKSVGKMGNTRHYMKPGYRGSVDMPNKEDNLVHICAFSLLPDSFHIIVEQRKEKGVSRFMQKIGTGYAGHLNAKRDTHGSVFAGTYKAAAIEGHDHLLEFTRFVHMLPLGIKFDNWHTTGIDDWGEALAFLREYPWSSYLDYAGKRDTFFIESSIAREHFPEGKEYEEYVRSWTPE